MEELPHGAGEPNKPVHINPLANAIDRLREGYERHCREPDDDQLRDGLILRFEFTYELAHKMLRRYLRMVSPTPDEYDQMPFQDLIRTGNEQNLLLGDWPKWRRYRDLRPRTSHTYAAKVAVEVVDGIPEFLAEAEHLRNTLARRPA